MRGPLNPYSQPIGPPLDTTHPALRPSTWELPVNVRPGTVFKSVLQGTLNGFKIDWPLQLNHSGYYQILVKRGSLVVCYPVCVVPEDLKALLDSPRVANSFYQRAVERWPVSYPRKRSVPAWLDALQVAVTVNYPSYLLILSSGVAVSSVLATSSGRFESGQFRLNPGRYSLKLRLPVKYGPVDLL